MAKELYLTNGGAEECRVPALKGQKQSGRSMLYIAANSKADVRRLLEEAGCFPPSSARLTTHWYKGWLGNDAPEETPFRGIWLVQDTSIEGKAKLIYDGRQVKAKGKNQASEAGTKTETGLIIDARLEFSAGNPNEQLVFVTEEGSIAKGARFYKGVFKGEEQEFGRTFLCELNGMSKVEVLQAKSELRFSISCLKSREEEAKGKLREAVRNHVKNMLAQAQRLDALIKKGEEQITLKQYRERFRQG
ncbi:hypothetical protein HNP46_000400 [Pseudomonas nitritireducens]|uniref:Uncharacterized protein n=1 Tax=Pseudomonas nitroreducens TaxID=46680 RepID=A0A7W7NZG9_PSENT|nr:hypothetical protein [Pseudomonas nitritireducens]MBB4861589.1 hypothetical protein [Pseudomonas nitritireducens]